MQIEARNDGIGTVFNGAVSIDLSHGDDRLNFGLDANDFVTTNATVKLSGGKQLDILDQPGVNVFAKPPVTKDFELLL